jgi:hypothetical protein
MILASVVEPVGKTQPMLGQLEQQVTRPQEPQRHPSQRRGQLVIPASPPATTPGACGQTTSYLHVRSATVTTVSRPITLSRPS